MPTKPSPQNIQWDAETPGKQDIVWDKPKIPSGAGRTFAPTLWEEMVENLLRPQSMGGIIGGIGGTTLFPGLGTLGGTLAGAALGGLGGRTEEEFRRPQIAPPVEIAKRIALGGAEEAAYELGGGLIAKGAGRVLAPAKKTMTEVAGRGAKILQKHMPRGLFMRKYPLLPAETGEGFLLDALQGISEGAFFGSHVIRKYRVGRREALNESLVKDLGERFGAELDGDQLGNTIVGFFRKRFKSGKLMAEPYYNAVGEMTENIPFPTQKLKDIIAPRLKLAKGVRKFDAEAETIVDSIVDLEDIVSYADLKEMRSALLQKVRLYDMRIETKGSAAAGLAKRVLKEVDLVIDTTLKKKHPEARDMWRQGNRLWKEASTKYNNRMIRRLFRQADPNFGGEPEKVLETIFKKRRAFSKMQIKQVLGPELWGQTKGWYVQELLEKSTTKEGYLMAEMFEGHMKRMGDKALKTIFDPDELKNLKDVVGALKLTQIGQKKMMGEAGGAPGRVWIQLTQAGILFGGGYMISQGQYGQATLILGGPYLLGKAFTNPLIARQLVQGFLYSGGKYSQRGAAAMGRALGLMPKLQEQIQRLAGKEAKKEEEEIGR